MISISVCMIVKNEETILRRCLDSLRDIADEIILVDTGSTDRTKEIAAEYTDRIFDFPWVDDFSKARNFAFSKATKEYIYTADADEVLDEENRKKFLDLKKVLLPEIEIVQMYYANQLEYGTTYNFDKEYRPKLFKRLRTFVWEEPIHENVRITPVIYDSEIEITHKPHELHAKRDFGIFKKLRENGEHFSSHLYEMYARELAIAGDTEDYEEAVAFFEEQTKLPERTKEEVVNGYCILARAYRLLGRKEQFLETTSRFIGEEPVSELCFEMGEYYYEKYSTEKERDAVKAGESLAEAVVWYYHAAFAAQPVLNLKSHDSFPLERLITCEKLRENEEAAEEYRKEAERRMV